MTREPRAARFHFAVRALRGVHAFLIGTFRGYYSRSDGWVVLTTRGRKTGLPREVLLPGTRTADGVIVMSTYGHRSDWIRNIRRDPRVTVTRAGHVITARAEIVEDVTRKQALVAAHPFFPPAPIKVLNVLARTMLRRPTVAFLERWVVPRPIVVIRYDDSAETS